MIRIIILQIFFLFLLKLNVNGQNEANVWIFGNNNGLDFNVSIPPTLIYSNGSIGLNASISNKNTGSLLFYASWHGMYNRNNQLMDSIDLGSGNYAENIIVPETGNDSMYYLFTANRNPSCGITYSVINMNLDTGFGGVEPGQLNQFLDSGYTNNSRIAAIRHSNDCEIWVVSHEWQTDAFRSYLIHSSGISGPVISHVGNIYTTPTFMGCYKFSPDGKKLACIADNRIVQVFDFDRSTGIIAPNPIDLFFSDLTDGMAFSPDNSKLYINMRGGNIYQYDMNAGTTSAIVASQTIINPSPNNLVYRAKLQTGPDKKIYVSWDTSVRQEIGFISNPNASGLACNYIDSVIILPNSTNDSFVNFIESYFYEPPLHVTVDSTGCANDPLHFAADSVENATAYLWSMGNGDTIQGRTVTYTYPAAGTYTVKLIILFNCLAPLEITKTVIVKPVPAFTLPASTYICRNRPLLLDCGVTAESYLWSTGETTCSIEVNSAGNYIITATDSGCSAVHSVSVMEGDSSVLKASNIFTPNGDGKNDFFYLSHEDESVQRLTIFDRWGRNVFESDKNKRWNGKNNSGTASEGVYYYIAELLDCNSQPFTIKGTVTLKR